MNANTTINISSAPLSVNGQPLGGGFSFAYDLGGSTLDYANQSMNFLTANNSADQAFLSGTIAGTQSFLAHQSTPLLDAITSMQSINNAQLQTNNSVATSAASAAMGVVSQNTGLGSNLANLFYTQQGANYTGISSLANTAIAQIGTNVQSSNNASQSVASSNSNSGSLCFITTAICEAENLPDDCSDLQTLRKFRDSFMLSSDETSAMVKEYYEKAPSIVAKIKARDNAKEIFAFIRRFYLNNAIHHIQNECNACALSTYRAMFLYCERL